MYLPATEPLRTHFTEGPKGYPEKDCVRFERNFRSVQLCSAMEASSALGSVFDNKLYTTILERGLLQRRVLNDDD